MESISPRPGGSRRGAAWCNGGGGRDRGAAERKRGGGMASRATTGSWRSAIVSGNKRRRGPAGSPADAAGGRDHLFGSLTAPVPVTVVAAIRLRSARTATVAVNGVAAQLSANGLSAPCRPPRGGTGAEPLSRRRGDAGIGLLAGTRPARRRRHSSGGVRLHRRREPRRRSSFEGADRGAPAPGGVGVADAR